jgi:hypothetical protein
MRDSKGISGGGRTLRFSGYAFMAFGLIMAACEQKPATSLGEGNSAAATSQSSSSEAIAAELSQGNFGQAAEMARTASLAKPNGPQLSLLLRSAEARPNNLWPSVDALVRDL